MPERSGITRKELDQLDYIDLLNWRLALLAKSKESNNQGVFTIRGHHVLKYFRLLNGETPFSMAEEVIDGAHSMDNVGTWYLDDVIGQSPRDEYIFQTLIQSLYQEIVSMGPQSKIKLVYNNDEICNACKVGEHCKQPKNGNDEKYESKYIAGVIMAARELGLEDYLIVTSNEKKLRSKYYQDKPKTMLTTEMPKWVFVNVCEMIRNQYGNDLNTYVESKTGQNLNEDDWYANFVLSLSRKI